MNNLIVTANSVVSDTINAVIAELDLREDTKALSFDLKEAIATHIVITDTDWVQSE